MNYGVGISMLKRIRMTKQISLIVPILNEEKLLPAFIRQCQQLALDKLEVLFVDGGSHDSSLKIIESSGFRLVQSKAGRAVQMNAAAEIATGPFFLFLHIDVCWDDQFLSELNRLRAEEVQAANFKLRFDWSHWFLSLNSWFSRFTASGFQYGDQGLWINQKFFKRIGGFKEEMRILEDQDIIRRIQEEVRLVKSKSVLCVSARKYRLYGPYRLQFFYIGIYMKYRLGWSHEKLTQSYERFLVSNQVDSST